jgi:hypothetical protein
MITAVDDRLIVSLEYGDTPPEAEPPPVSIPKNPESLHEDHQQPPRTAIQPA